MRKSFTASRLLLIATLCIFASVSAGLSQSTTGTILGTVKDQSGGVLPGVSVTVKNTDTGATREVVTDDGGRYKATALTLGNYTAEAGLAGFQTEVRSGIKLTIGREAQVDFTLGVGEISEKVQVTGDAPIVETTNTAITALVDDKTIRDLPLNGRSFSDLVTLQMGAVPQVLGAKSSASGFGLKISVSGARPSENSFLLDGNFVNDALNNTPAGATGYFLGVETLREFTVMSNTFSAEYGQSAGAIVNAVTKSGTNELHGSAFYFHRNSALDARNFFDRNTRDPLNRSNPPPFRRHQFGGVIGGPIIKNKTFFFGGYEGLREFLATTQVATTLTAGIRSQAVPGIVPYLVLFPLPNGQILSSQTGEYLFPSPKTSREHNFVNKIDHTFSDKDSMFVRYTFDDADVLLPGLNFREGLQTRAQYITVEEKKVMSAALLNVARFGFNRSSISDDDHPQLDVTKLSLVPSAFSAIPSLGLGQLGNFGVTGTSIPGLGNGSAVPRVYHFNLFEYSDTLSYLKGAHSFKFGADIKRVQSNLVSPQRLYGTITFNSIADFLAGNLGVFQYVKPGSDAIRGIRFTAMGFFAQDDIRVSNKLTVNLGLRYEPSTEHSEVNGKMANLRDPLHDATLTVGPLFLNPTKKNWAPRVGIAWDPFGDGKTSIRAGFGIFYNIQMSELDRITATSNPPFTVVSAFNGPARFPFNFNDILSGAQPTAPALETIDYHAKQPYRLQYNLNIQREIVKDTSLTIGYVGARGIHLFRPIGNINQALPIAPPDNSRPYPYFFPVGARPANPNFGPVVYRVTDADSYYNSFQLNLNKRFSHGFQVQGAYTFSKSIDDSSKQIRGPGETSNVADGMNPFDARADRGLSEFDSTHHASINYTYDLPGQGMQGMAGKVVGGWQVGGIMTFGSGLPFNVLAGYDTCRCLNGASGGAGGTNNTRPDLAPGANNNPVLGGPDKYFDPSVFLAPPTGYYGNLGRNTLRIPGVADVDFSLTKKTAINEKVSAQFRAEIFNIFNRANFGAPNASIFQGSAAVRNASVARISATTTTSRQIQFGLKLVF